MENKFADFLRSDALKVILIALLIRLIGLSSLYIADESVWTENVKLLHDGIFDPTRYIPHPPLGVIVYFISTSLFGISIAGMRIVPLAAGIGIMCIMYYLSKKIYDHKTAIAALILSAVSFYPVWSSLYVDLDGGILLMLMVATIASYLRFRESGDNVWLRAAAAIFGLALLVKYTAVLVIPILILTDMWGRSITSGVKGMIERMLPIAYLSIIGLLIFSIFPAFSFMTGNQAAFYRTFSYGSDTVLTDSISTQVHTPSGIMVSFAKNIFFILQYASPIIPILAILALRNRNPKENVLLSWIAVAFFFYTVIVPGGGKVRYLMVLIPPLYILAAKGLTGAISSLGKKDAAYLVALSAAFLAILTGLNMYGTSQTFNLQKLSAQTIIQNGFLWYSGHGSSPFAIHVHSFIFVVVLSAVLFAVSFRKIYFRNAMIILLALNIAFTALILFQSFYPTVGPQYEKTVALAASDLRSAEGPIYGMAQFKNVLNVYLGDERASSYEAGDKGTLVLIDVQLLENPTFQKNYNSSISKCALKKTYYSAGYPFIYVYNC